MNVNFVLEASLFLGQLFNAQECSDAHGCITFQICSHICLRVGLSENSLWERGL